MMEAFNGDAIDNDETINLHKDELSQNIFGFDFEERLPANAIVLGRGPTAVDSVRGLTQSFIKFCNSLPPQTLEQQELDSKVYHPFVEQCSNSVPNLCIDSIKEFFWKQVVRADGLVSYEKLRDDERDSYVLQIFSKEFAPRQNMADLCNGFYQYTNQRDIKYVHRVLNYEGDRGINQDIEENDYGKKHPPNLPDFTKKTIKNIASSNFDSHPVSTVPRNSWVGTLESEANLFVHQKMGQSLQLGDAVIAVQNDDTCHTRNEITVLPAAVCSKNAPKGMAKIDIAIANFADETGFGPYYVGLSKKATMIILRSHYDSELLPELTGKYRAFRSSIERKKIRLQRLESDFYIPFMKMYPILFPNPEMKNLSGIFYEESVDADGNRNVKKIGDKERDVIIQKDIQTNGLRKKKSPLRLQTMIESMRKKIKHRRHEMKPVFERLLYDIESTVPDESDSKETPRDDKLIKDYTVVVKKFYDTMFDDPPARKKQKKTVCTPPSASRSLWLPDDLTETECILEERSCPFQAAAKKQHIDVASYDRYETEGEMTKRDDKLVKERPEIAQKLDNDETINLHRDELSRNIFGFDFEERLPANAIVLGGGPTVVDSLHGLTPSSIHRTPNNNNNNTSTTKSPFTLTNGEIMNPKNTLQSFVVVPAAVSQPTPGRILDMKCYMESETFVLPRIRRTEVVDEVAIREKEVQKSSVVVNKLCGTNDPPGQKYQEDPPGQKYQEETVNDDMSDAETVVSYLNERSRESQVDIEILAAFEDKRTEVLDEVGLREKVVLKSSVVVNNLFGTMSNDPPGQKCQEDAVDDDLSDVEREVNERSRESQVDNEIQAAFKDELILQFSMCDLQIASDDESDQ